MSGTLRWRWVSLALTLLVASEAAADEVLINDPLGGATVGERRGGGEFVAGGGWRSQGGNIVYDAGRVLEDGWFQCTMRGWVPPGAGIDKSHPLSGWELAEQYTHYAQMGSFWNWRIGTGYFPFKVLAAPRTIDTRVEARVGDVDALPDDGPHTYRVEWRGGVVRFLFDGELLQEWVFDRFAMRYFLIGKDEQYGITNPAPIIADVVVGELTVEGDPDPPDPPDPPPDPVPGDQTITLEAVQDTFADPRAPMVPQGALDTLQVGGDGAGAEGRTIYLQFDLGAVGGEMLSAELRMQATNGGEGGVLRTVADDDWREADLTWAQRPAVGDAVVAALGPVSAGASYGWNLAPPLPEAGARASFAVTSTAENGAAFSSREHPDVNVRPTLVVQYRVGAPDPDDAGSDPVDGPGGGIAALDAGDEQDSGESPDSAPAGGQGGRVEGGGGALGQGGAPGQGVGGGEGNASGMQGGCACRAGGSGSDGAGLLLLLMVSLLRIRSRTSAPDR